MTSIKKYGLVIAISLSGVGSAAAECSEAMLQKLLAQGFSRAEILQLCGGQAGTAGQAGPVSPPPAQPPMNPQVDVGAALVGLWIGKDYLDWQWQFTFNADKTYQVWMRNPAGVGAEQSGTWTAANSLLNLNPTSTSAPTPLRPESHAYTLEENGSVLVIQGANGPLRLSKRS